MPIKTPEIATQQTIFLKQLSFSTLYSNICEPERTKTNAISVQTAQLYGLFLSGNRGTFRYVEESTFQF